MYSINRVIVIAVGISIEVIMYSINSVRFITYYY